MRCLSGFLILSVAVALAAQTAAKPAADVPAADRLFDYDQKQPLDIHDKIIEEFDGGTLHDITYTSPKVVPSGRI